MPIQRSEASNEILTTLNSLKKEGALKKFGRRLEDGVDRRKLFNLQGRGRRYALPAILICLHPLPGPGNVFMGELRRVGVKVPDSIGKLSVRNDAAFLITVVGTTSVVAVAGGFLPGDWVRLAQQAA